SCQYRSRFMCLVCLSPLWLLASLTFHKLVTAKSSEKQANQLGSWGMSLRFYLCSLHIVFSVGGRGSRTRQCVMVNKAMVWDCLHSASLRFGSPTSRR